MSFVEDAVSPRVIARKPEPCKECCSRPEIGATPTCLRRSASGPLPRPRTARVLPGPVVASSRAGRANRSGLTFNAKRHKIQRMIRSFHCADTQALYQGKRVARFANFRATAERKLQMLDSAATLDFLKSPPGNRLEPLKKDRIGQHSIGINDQWRICFIWTDQGPTRVEIVDYH